MRKLLTTLVTAVGLMASVSANAELITNGGFEIGDMTGWQGHGAFAWESYEFAPHSGNKQALFGAVGDLESIAQTIPTVAGQSYNFSFYYASDGGLPNEFQAYFGGQKVFDLVNDPVHGYVLESFTVTASTNSTTITFAGQNDPSYQYLDDVSVTEVKASNVPEPTSVALLGLGLFSFVAARRKSAKDKNA